MASAPPGPPIMAAPEPSTKRKQEALLDTLYIFHIALQLVLLWYLYSMTLTYVYTSVLIQLMTQVQLF